MLGIVQLHPQGAPPPMKRAITCMCVLLSLCLQAQEPLTNETIIKLVKAGIGEEVVMGMVNQQAGKYALSADDVIALKRAGESDKVVAAMIFRGGAAGTAAVPSGATGDIPSQPVAAVSNNLPSSPSVDGASIRVYVSDSQSWEIRGGWSAGGNKRSWSGGGYQAGGARPQTAEIIKTFNQRCPEVTVTNNVEKADFAVLLDHEGGKGYARRRNKIVVFNRAGDGIFSDSTRSLGNSVKDACEAILKTADYHGPNEANVPSPAAASTFIPAGPAVASSSKGLMELTFIST